MSRWSQSFLVVVGLASACTPCGVPWASEGPEVGNPCERRKMEPDRRDDPLLDIAVVGAVGALAYDALLIMLATRSDGSIANQHIAGPIFGVATGAAGLIGGWAWAATSSDAKSSVRLALPLVLTAISLPALVVGTAQLATGKHSKRPKAPAKRQMSLLRCRGLNCSLAAPMVSVGASGALEVGLASGRF